MDKSPDAFRTISEVADHLDTPAHVLRFWESRFPQIRPVKRAGGRRYYRPADVALLTGIKRLLHDEGLTIRGVQKILREHGVRHVAGLSGEPLPDDIEMDAEAALEAALAANFGAFDGESVSPERAESATIVALETALRRPAAEAPVVADLFERTQDPRQPVEMDTISDLVDDQAAVFDATSKQAAPDASLTQGNLAAALRALPAGAFAPHPEAIALHARLVALQQTLLAPPVFGRA
jgi:DNA-binding transcriptional MerR regulator